MPALRERVKNKIDDLTPNQLLELSRIINLFTVIKKPKRKKRLNLTSYSCGKKLRDFNRTDAYETRF